MMIVPLAVDIRLHTLGKVFDADLIITDSGIAPVPGSLLAHIPHVNKSIHHTVLLREEFVSLLIPVMSGNFLVGCFELFILSILGKLPLQIGNIGDRAAKAQGVVEHLQENIYDGILVEFSIGFALGVDVEDDHIGRCIGGQLHIR